MLVAMWCLHVLSRPDAVCPLRLLPQGLSEERALWHLGASTNLRGTRVMLPKRRRGKPKAE